MEFIVFGEHGYFSWELFRVILAFEELLSFVIDLCLFEVIGGPGLELVAGLLKFHYYVDVGDLVVGLVACVFCH